MSSEYAEPLLAAGQLYDLACAAVMFGLCWAIGALVLRRAGFQPDSAIDRSLFGTAVGVGVLSTLVLVLGWMSLLRRWALGVLVVALVAVTLGSWKVLHEELSRTRRELVARMGQPGLIVLFVVAGFLVLQASMPPSDWDVLTYHLNVPAEFLARGEVFLPVDNHHTAFVGLQHMLYMPLLAAGATSAPALLSAGFALLLVITMLAAGRRLLNESTGRLASVLVWGSPVVLLVAVTARVDVTAAWLLLLTHYAVVVCLQRRRLDGWFWMAALLGGLAFAIKYSALAYLAALSPVIVWALARGTSSPLRGTGAAMGFGGLFLLVAAPWLVKNIILFGAPLYPYLAEFQLESWLASYVGSSAVPASVDPEAFQIPAQTREPFSLVALFTDPGSMTPEREGAFYFANLALLFLPLAIIVRQRQVVAALLVPSLLYVALVVYPDGMINLRYLVPALVVLTLTASVAIVETGRRILPRGSVRKFLVTVLVVLSLLPAAAAAYMKIDEMRPHEVWMGLRSEGAYLRQSVDPDVYLHARARDWINGRLESDDRVVMLFESRGYGFEPEVLQDNLNRTWAVLASQLPWQDCLASTEATYVLVNFAHFGSLIRRGLDSAIVDWPAFGRFVQACLEREGAVGGVVLYRIVS